MRRGIFPGSQNQRPQTGSQVCQGPEEVHLHGDLRGELLRGVSKYFSGGFRGERFFLGVWVQGTVAGRFLPFAFQDVCLIFPGWVLKEINFAAGLCFFPGGLSKWKVLKGKLRRIQVFCPSRHDAKDFRRACRPIGSVRALAFGF